MKAYFFSFLLLFFFVSSGSVSAQLSQNENGSGDSTPTIEQQENEQIKENALLHFEIGSVYGLKASLAEDGEKEKYHALERKEYERAIQLDPENQLYKVVLKILDDFLQEQKESRGDK